MEWSIWKSLLVAKDMIASTNAYVLQREQYFNQIKMVVLAEMLYLHSDNSQKLPIPAWTLPSYNFLFTQADTDASAAAKNSGCVPPA